MRSARRVKPRRKVVWGARIGLGVALLCAAALISSCDAVRQGRGSSYLILTNLAGGSGATVSSDVVSDTGSIVADAATASFQLAMKNVAVTPTANNAITVDRYHVNYVRSDGHNVQGVDVPFAFDGAITVTVTSNASVGFTIVRIQAKEEAPLKTLSSGGAAISTIAQVTFYGHDQTGAEVSVTGNIEVTFANFAG
jgi:hypothetical protein